MNRHSDIEGMALELIAASANDPMPFWQWKQGVTRAEAPVLRTKQWYQRNYGRYVDAHRKHTKAQSHDCPLPCVPSNPRRMPLRGRLRRGAAHRS